MKKYDRASFLLDNSYIECSECLREVLESKIDSLYSKNTFAEYASPSNGFMEADQHGELLCAYLISEGSCFLSKSPKLLSKGLRTWFNMYYDDRISVLDKFRDCYYRSVIHCGPLNMEIIPVIFCKFLIDELLITLSAPQWQLLNHKNHLNWFKRR